MDGDYQLGGQGVTVKGRKAILTKNPDVIAGSVTNLLDCMRNCVQNMGIPLEDAVLAATENPQNLLEWRKTTVRLQLEIMEICFYWIKNCG